MTNSSGTKYNQGEVWIARIHFTIDPTKYKARPVVIVGNELALDLDVIINPITTEVPRNDFDVELKYWKEAGLAGPSHVRTSKPLTILGSALHKKIGELHHDDLAFILKKCREIF